MRIALIQCPVWGTYDPPLALAQLSSCLKKAGNEVRSFDLNIKFYLTRAENYKHMWAWEQSLFWYDRQNVDKYFADNESLIKNYIDEILNYGPKVIGFSVNAASILSSIKVARMIKHADPSVTVIFGGPLFFEQKNINEVFNESIVDIIVPGEGEVTLPELAHFIESKKDISACPGIYFMKNKEVVCTKKKEMACNLDFLPFMDFSDLPLSDYDDPRHSVFMASRGCIQKCVFCSSRAFWPGYKAMSGKRIFEEIKTIKVQQKNLGINIGHVDFIDLMFNGNMKYLIEFCDLMIKENLDLAWSANMIVRPEMSRDVIKKIKDSGCKHIIFGIESGSQRVLNLMRKNYKVKDADRIIKDMHEMGIVVTGNFMFGFPGETEEDFKETLNFIEKNAKFLDRVYPSRTYCAIEEFSYLANHLEEFDIKANPPNHLFWESMDGFNTYLLRLKRCSKFSELAFSLGIEVGCGVQTSVQLDEFFNLYQYYEAKKDYTNAVEYLLKYFDLEPSNEIVINKLKEYFLLVNDQGYSLISDINLLSKLTRAIFTPKKEKSYIEKTANWVVGRERSLRLLTAMQSSNSYINAKEFSDKKFIYDNIVTSSPLNFYLKIFNSCSSDLILYVEEENHRLFDLQHYRKSLEEKISMELSKTERIIFDNKIDFLSLQNMKEILDYFDEYFPHVEKVFSTNASSLVPWACDRIMNGKSKYTIHASLHASNASLHKTITRMDNFEEILDNIKRIIQMRTDKQKPRLHLIFVATTLNIEDLPNFVRLASELGVDKVICYYNYIYIPSQKYLSCFFKQDMTNEMLDEAEALAKKLNIAIDLPPRFNQKEYPDFGICREPFSQIMFDSQGHILPCDASEDCDEILSDGKNFMDIWNSPYYKKFRKSLIEGNSSCFKHCLRANPASVNDFKSHVIHRGNKNNEEINILWGDNF